MNTPAIQRELVRLLVAQGRRSEALALLSIEWETEYVAAMRELTISFNQLRDAFKAELLPAINQFVRTLDNFGKDLP